MEEHNRCRNGRQISTSRARCTAPACGTGRGPGLRQLVLLVALVAPVAVLLTGSRASAVGVAAGTTIQNQASASYDVGATSLTVQSAVNSVTVDEIVDVSVTLQSPPVAVSPNDTGRVLTYLVTNTGNGVEVIEFDPDSVLPGDNFDPTFNAIYLDDGDGLFDALVDTPYTKGFNDPSLDANDPGNDSITVFLLNDIPGTASNGETGLSRLTATSAVIGAQAPGTVVANGGDGGIIDAMVGTSGAQDAQDGTYIVAAVNVTLTKAATILPHATFGIEPVPGATIQYSITVSVTGSGTAQNLVVTDPIPANTIFVNNSIVLSDGSGTTPLSDAADADAGDYDVTLAGAVTVDLGDVAGGAADSTVTFNVLIDPN